MIKIKKNGEWKTISGNKSGSGDVSEYTYIVDSDQKLLDWATIIAGNDYTSVLIKKGTWTTNLTINLTAAGTKRVKGEAGSKIIANGTASTTYGLYFETLPEGTSYSIDGVTVEATGSFAYAGFYNCRNLTNCTAIGTEYAKYGYYQCNILTNCYGNFPTYSAFEQCTDLTSCIGITGNNSGGFNSCKILTSCKGSGRYGFMACKGVNRCSAYAHCANSVFFTCYSNLEASSNTVADTAEGGFNSTTNPS